MPCQWAESQFWKTINAQGPCRTRRTYEQKLIILLERPYGEDRPVRPRKTLVSCARYDSGDEPFFPSAGEILARGPAASPKAYSILAGFEKWMIRMPCARRQRQLNATLIATLRALCFLAGRWVGVASPNLPRFMLLYDTGRQTDLGVEEPASSF